MEKTKHISVLLQKSIASLNIRPNGVYIDTTLGGAGHAKSIMQQMQNKGVLVVCDRDPKPIKNFETELVKAGFVVEVNQNARVLVKEDLRILLLQINFAALQENLQRLKINKVDGILTDLGISTDQLLDQQRGFSYLTKGKLDMRMDPSLRVTAADLVNGLYQKELEDLFLKLGDVDFASKLARLIIKSRQKKLIKTVADLKGIVQKIVPSDSRIGANRHPEAKVFQALRIAVNDELNSLRVFLPQAFETLSSGGRLSVITFHSGEDRIVKNVFRDLVTEKKAEYIHKLLKPDDAELTSNTRSHSAKLRVIEKI